MGWDEIAVAIAAGALQEVGAKILDALLGGDKPDFRAILMDALRTFATLLKKELDREFIEHYQAERDGLVDLFGQYKNNTTNAQLRETLRERAVVLTHEIQRFDIQTVPPFCVVGGLALSSIQEIYIHSGDAGDRKNIASEAERLVAQRPVLEQKLHEFNASRFSDQSSTAVVRRRPQPISIST